VLDAKREKDGQIVVLKVVPVDTPEIAIASYLCSNELKDDPKNHTIPLLDVLHDPSDPSHAIIVTPLLRRIDGPYPKSIRECVKFTDIWVVLSVCQYAENSAQTLG